MSIIIVKVVKKFELVDGQEKVALTAKTYQLQELRKDALKNHASSLY